MNAKVIGLSNKAFNRFYEAYKEEIGFYDLKRRLNRCLDNDILNEAAVHCYELGADGRSIVMTKPYKFLCDFADDKNIKHLWLTKLEINEAGLRLQHHLNTSLMGLNLLELATTEKIASYKSFRDLMAKAKEAVKVHCTYEEFAKCIMFEHYKGRLITGESRIARED